MKKVVTRTTQKGQNKEGAKMKKIGNPGNMNDTSELLIEGGGNDTWYKVIHASDEVSLFVDYPSLKDGQPVSWTEPDFWKYKTRRSRPALQLTVAGNAVCAEGALRDMGYDAHAIQPTVVMLVLKEE